VREKKESPMPGMILLREGSQGQADEVFTLLPAAPPLSQPQPLFFPAGNEVAEWFFASGMAERPLISWIVDTFISPDACFLDIGAHVGTYTWTAGKKALHTHAFECNPRSFCYLAANVALHDLADKVTLHSCALSDYDGRASFIHRSEDGGGSGIRELSAADAALPRTEVRVVRLDSLELPGGRIGFVKIDVEGAEREVFLGAVETLRRNDWPPVLFESWGEWRGEVASQLRAELFAVVAGLGYDIQPVSLHIDTFLATRL
jgi:FkbM family methyltransferase